MSIENAILELAAAIRELAVSNNAVAPNFPPLFVNGVDINAGTIEQDVAKVEADAKAAQQKAMDKVSTGKQEIADALAKAKAEKAAAAKKAESETAIPNAQSQGAGQGSDDPLDAAPLDWDKDVRPALLAVGKDRDALVKLMGKYEVPKGGKAPTEKWAALLAEANAIVAARG